MLKIGDKRQHIAYSVQRSSPQAFRSPSAKQSFRIGLGQHTLKKKFPLLNAERWTLNSADGLTLIELLVVVLIIGLLTIIALPTFSKFGSNTRLKSTAQQIDALLRTAKNFATTRNTTCIVKIHPRDIASPNQIELTYEEGGTEKQADKIWIAPPLIEIPDVSKYHGGIQTVEFKSDGRSTFSSGPECSIHIIQRGTLINGSPYNPDANYDGQSKAERVKCHTITTDSATGRSKNYHYGRNDPWSAADL